MNSTIVSLCVVVLMMPMMADALLWWSNDDQHALCNGLTGPGSLVVSYGLKSITFCANRQYICHIGIEHRHILVPVFCVIGAVIICCCFYDALRKVIGFIIILVILVPTLTLFFSHLFRCYNEGFAPPCNGVIRLIHSRISWEDVQYVCSRS